MEEIVYENLNKIETLKKTHIMNIIGGEYEIKEKVNEVIEKVNTIIEILNGSIKK